MVNWFISAGDVSGDIHASGLIREVSSLRPDITWHGLGGEPLAEAGCRLLVPPEKEPVMGFRRVLARIPHYFSLLARVHRHLLSKRPEVVILTDFPGLNLRIASLARLLGIPVVYFICPQLWAWAPWRIHRFARLVDLALVIFPFEEDYYRHHGVTAHYIGHPVCDKAEEDTKAPLPEGEILSLLPGSRRQELEVNLPVMLRTAKLILEKRPEMVPVVSHYRTDLLERTRDIAEKLEMNVHIVQGSMGRVIRSSRCCIVCSGTATLEVAFSRIPMVVTYRIGRFAKQVLVPALFTAPYFCQVNLMAGNELVPEVLLDNDDPGPVLDATLPLVEDGPAREAMKNGLNNFHARHFQPGAIGRAAGLVVKTFST
jgi:lipid-A-disaccharide synthase